ncbi:ADP-ribose glycohydrolase ARH3 isoform X3 [Fukomys damarensis]|uniref:ADP-ribose glycohydrolase ARH3 isoform X3 n=1 Tax=Fukomys damarensis TaxID=885580 RepID=UPI0005401956|nr:ADP-ribose glycohydrolase ARH3 isoform X3 [Fukomys damarensis]
MKTLVACVVLKKSRGKSGLISKALYYTDDTAMARALVQSLLAKEAFDEVDMAHRFAQEYKKDPDRGYGAGVITVFKKLLSPKCHDVYEPARAQFNGKGSYGNGGAMRVAGIPLAYSNVQDVQKFARLSAQLTHASSLGYNGAILQALAVHLALQGESSSEHFLEQLLGHMEELEGDAQAVLDARELGMEERPYSCRLKKVGELLDQDSVTREEVVSELGDGALCVDKGFQFFQPATGSARKGKTGVPWWLFVLKITLWPRQLDQMQAVTGQLFLLLDPDLPRQDPRPAEPGIGTL